MSCFQKFVNIQTAIHVPMINRYWCRLSSPDYSNDGTGRRVVSAIKQTDGQRDRSNTDQRYTGCGTETGDC